MPSPDILVQRMLDATREGDIAVGRQDAQRWLAAKAKYEKAEAELKVFEAAQERRNTRVIAELESKTNAWGELSHAKIRAAGVPFEVVEARGWVHLPDGRTGMFRKDC